MLRTLTSRLLFVALLLMISACIDDEVITTQITYPNPDRSPIVEESTDALEDCGTPQPQKVYFPRQELVEGPREVMEAELVGSLVLAEGCLRVESLHDDTLYLPIWPPGFQLVSTDDKFSITNSEGETVGRVGEEVFMGGGTGSIDAITSCDRQQQPDHCNGPFWVVGEGVRLNIQHDSDLIEVQPIKADKASTILLTKKPVLDEWVPESDIFSGQLVLYEPLRCPRIVSESGIKDFLPIWPQGYSLRMVDDSVEVLNSSGELVARQGSSISVSGGLIPHDWGSDKYRQLYHDVPGDCYGPYWVVRD